MTGAAMRIRVWCVLLAMGASAAGSVVVQAQLAGRASDEPAVVDRNRIAFHLPLPHEGMKAPSPPVAGYHVWRVLVETFQPFSVVVTSDTALRAGSPDDVVRAINVRLCEEPLVESARDCTSPVDAALDIRGDHILLTIRDSELVGRVRRDRPAAYWRWVIEQGGRYLLTRHQFVHPVVERP